MATNDLDQLRFDSAEEFLAALSPSHPRWHPDPLTWIFRGHANSSWKLFAKAYRVAQQPYAALGIECQLAPGAQEWSVYARAEEEMLERFSRGLDRAGLAVPAPALEVRPHGSERISDAETHPRAIPLLALAQHFGLPTKLLDWSRQSRVAAYFAAGEAATKPADDIDLAVWALRTDFIHSTDERGFDKTGLTIRTAPASSNPNLHAQQGLFTRTEGENAYRLTIDELIVGVSEAARSWDLKAWHDTEGKNPNAVPRPLLRCMRLPQRHAPRLLRLLAYEGITGSTMFPGYEGVIRAMREEVLWDVRARA